ncbi:hypothetical protein II906_07545 [bacterium]|nr:hypothetical protein [bacterium]
MIKHRLIYKLLKIIDERKAINFYIRRYLYVSKIAESECKTAPKTEYKNYIWTMWLQEEIPDICKMCINTIKKYYPQTIVITEKNFSEYVDVPEYIMQKYKEGEIRPCHFSDYIRMNLLDKYGGTWIDATCYLTQPIPNYILNSDFFILKNLQSQISNYFIHSVPNNYLTKCIKIFLEEYWKENNKAVNYFFFHHFMAHTLYKYDEKARNIIKSVPIGLNQNTKLMAKVLFDDYNEDIYNWLCQTSYLHKLTYKKLEENDINPNSLYRHIMKEQKEKSKIKV